MEEIHSSSSISESNWFNYPNNSPKKKKITHQFYFIKFHPSLVDPALKQKIERANEFIKRMEKSRAVISREISSIQLKMRKKKDELLWHKRNYSPCLKSSRRYIACLQRQLEIQWPGENNDIDLDLDSKVEEKVEDINVNVDEKIEELSNKLNHGRRNLAEERRMLRQLRELKEMQRRKEQLDHHVKTTTFQRPRRNSKECVQWRIRAALKESRDINEKERKLAEEYEAIKDETQKWTIPLEEKEAEINRKKVRANRRILKVRMQLDEQVATYDEYMTLKVKVKALAGKQDLLALGQLSYKQVEEFMSRWNSDELFRADYKRSVLASLRDRMLSHDGRRLDEELRRKIP